MRSEIQFPCCLCFVQLFSWAFGRRCTTILFIQKEVNSWILFVKAMNIVLWYFLVGSIFFWLPSDVVLVFYKSNFEKHEHLLAGKKKKMPNENTMGEVLLGVNKCLYANFASLLLYHLIRCHECLICLTCMLDVFS
jgi:hypothetical protein